MNNKTNPKISILIASMREPQTIGKAIKTITNGLNYDYELLLSIPDQETIQAAKHTIQTLGIENKTRFSELPMDGKPKGKPAELNELMNMASGDIWIFGDGDVYFSDNAANLLIRKLEDSNIFAVSGRPLSDDSRDNMFGYFGHLLADAAHHKRMIDLNDHPSGKSLIIVKKRKFFPVSGYLFAMRKTDIRAPIDCLSEDAYFSYAIHNAGLKIAYEPEALVYVKYPKTLTDYFKQKKRSAGGFVQLYKYGVVQKDTKTRSFFLELEYFWFPFKYAKNLKELLWSLVLYPIRLWQWILIHWEQKIRKKSFLQTWTRIESTK